MRQQDEISSRIDTILQGRDPDRPSVSLTASRDVLESSSTAELERLLASPELEAPENAMLRDELLGVLQMRCGNAYLDRVMEGVRDVDGDHWITEVSQNYRLDMEKTPAERAREALREYHCPLAEIVPEHVERFHIDTEGNFFMELEAQEMVHFSDFDMLLSEEISGRVEAERLEDLCGVSAMVFVQDRAVDITLTEMHVDGDRITVVTDHPLARVVQMKRDDFLFAVMATG